MVSHYKFFYHLLTQSPGHWALKLFLIFHSYYLIMNILVHAYLFMYSCMCILVVFPSDKSPRVESSNHC